MTVLTFMSAGEPLEPFIEGFLQWRGAWLVLLLAFGVVAGIASGLVLRWVRHDRASGRSAARRYCRAFGLSWPEAIHLRRLARAAGCTSVVPVLLSRGAFEFAVSGARGQLDDASVASLRRRIFAAA